ncbi:MAG TPA: carboxypeptidase-like regulatory domain-containing protein [Candidatus Andersenbacteria bacterium]|nr:carboxypeptidase-like regulatory domain-containing protein [Candidatus Andersenbacteria bacterium]
MKRLLISLCIGFIGMGVFSIFPANAQTIRKVPFVCNPFGYNADCPPHSIVPSEKAQEVLADQEKPIATTLATATLASSVPVVATNVLPSIAQFGQFIGSFFSLYKRKDRWGIVVDSDIGKPISQAVVQLFDVSNQLKETQVTGLSGQFGFIPPIGKYHIVVDSPGFIFPARRKPSIALRAGERIYLGEELDIDEQEVGKIPHLIVPMDRIEKLLPADAMLQRYINQVVDFLGGISFALLFIGSAINTYFFILTPGRLNTLFEVLYLILFILKLTILLFHARGVGKVINRKTGSSLDLSVVRLYDAKTNRLVQTKVTNKKGGFFILAPRGEYTVSVSKPGYKMLLIEKMQIREKGSKAVALNFSLEPVSG